MTYFLILLDPNLAQYLHGTAKEQKNIIASTKKYKHLRHNNKKVVNFDKRNEIIIQIDDFCSFCY